MDTNGERERKREEKRVGCSDSTSVSKHEFHRFPGGAVCCQPAFLPFFLSSCGPTIWGDIQAYPNQTKANRARS